MHATVATFFWLTSQDNVLIGYAKEAPNGSVKVFSIAIDTIYYFQVYYSLDKKFVLHPCSS